MTTPATPYVLFKHVPLSECRQLWWAWVGYGKPPEGWHGNDIERWRNVLAHRCLRRQLKAVTAERDETQRALDGALDNLEHVTAERDAWQKSAEELVEEADYLKRVRRESDAFAIRYAAERDKLRAERDELRRELDAMTGEL